MRQSSPSYMFVGIRATPSPILRFFCGTFGNRSVSTNKPAARFIIITRKLHDFWRKITSKEELNCISLEKDPNSLMFLSAKNRDTWCLLHRKRMAFFCIKVLFKAFHHFKTSKKGVWSNDFWYVKVYIFWKLMQYTIHWDKTQTLKKFPSDKINVAKTALFFFRELQLITVLLLIRTSYTSWSTRFIFLRLCLGLSHFRFRFVFIAVYIFVQQKELTLWL